MAEVRMPKMGDGMEEGTINSWLKKEGDQIASGESIAEVATDKANVEISAYESGVLTQIIVREGQTVPVGEVIAVIGGAAPSAGSSNGAAASAGSPAQNRSGGAPAGAESKAPPVETSPEPASRQEEPARGPVSERVKASPLARRMAAELAIDLARLSGTGPGGRIVERDIKAYQERRPATETRTPLVAVPTPDTRTPTPSAPQVIKPSKMREAIAKRTVLSKQSVPHFYVTMVVEMDRVQALLKELNADVQEGKITVNDIIIKACAVALGRVPEVNATWTSEGTIRRYAEAHIGVAVGIEEGLIIPVVRDCHLKTLRQISADTKALIGKARNNQLKPDEYSGGTFSISNLGMMGVEEFIAIINPPEAAILAIGGIVREPVVLEGSDEIVIRSRMKITLSSDHRLLDGVIAARFVQEVKKALEAPFSLLS
jgi:pyruvate dehydrogenase E2 component (dihydrolipoamide acetyltransferase)